MDMVEVGDRVVVESERVGIAERRGTVIGFSGHMLRIHWDDDGESLLMPGAGALRVVGHIDVKEGQGGTPG
jgi:hypothetical protein